MQQSDPTGKQLLAKYKIPMPNQNATDAEIKGYVAYFKWADEHLQPHGATQPQPAAPGSAKTPDETFSAPPGTHDPVPPGQPVH